MKRIYMLTFILLGLAWRGCNSDNSELLEELNEVIAPLPGASPTDYTDSYLEELVPWKNYLVIGLGEATHGTMDFFELKQRLFRFLAEQHQCRVLAYEYSYRKSLLINDYIHHRNDCLDSLFQGDLWIQDNETVRQFIKWMRDFNAERDADDQFSFIGIDNQVDALMLPEVLRQISDYLTDFKLDRNLFPYNLPGKKTVTYEDMNEAEYKELKYAFLQLKYQVKSYSLSLADPQAKERAEVALQLVRSLQGSHEFLYLIYAEGKNIRDRQLADNVLRIVAENGDSTRVVVWAHNAHIASNPHYYPDGSAAMGWYLRDSIRESYFSVGTSFSEGKFTAVMLDSVGNDTPPMTCQIREEPPAGSLNALFHQARYPEFSLNIGKLDPERRLFQFFDTPRPMIGVGDLYLGSAGQHFTDDRIINLAQAHDLLFYFKNTRPLL